MASSTLASSNPSLSRIFFASEDNPPPRHREASFSSFLGAADETFSLRLSGEFTDIDAASVRISLESGMNKEKKKTVSQGDDEIDVFGAEKYFNGVLDADQVAGKPEKPRRPSPARDVKFAGRKSRSGAPSTFSEARAHSWSALLKDAQKSPTPCNLQKLPPPPASSKRLRGVFRCSCSGKSSVQVDRVTNVSSVLNPASWRKQVQLEFCYSKKSGWQKTDKVGGAFVAKREDCPAIPPALNPEIVGNLAIVGKVFEEEGRKARISSTSVYGAPFLGKEFGSGPRRSLSMINLFPAGAAAAVDDDDDVCSECSSDLFEIDSVSTSTLHMGPGGAMSASTTCSAPSEASVEWSVVTASAAKLSAASDGEMRPPEAWKSSGGKHRPSGGGLLLGCGGRKAVSIASNAHKVPEVVGAAEWPWRSRSMAVTAPVIRYHPESSRLGDPRQVQAGLASMIRGIPCPISTAKPYVL